MPTIARVKSGGRKDVVGNPGSVVGERIGETENRSGRKMTNDDKENWRNQVGVHGL